MYKTTTTAAPQDVRLTAPLPDATVGLPSFCDISRASGTAVSPCRYSLQFTIALIKRESVQHNSPPRNG
jgi:hypothetical protein